MTARVRFAVQLMRAGLYEWRGLLAWVAGAAASLGVLAALEPSVLPSQLVPYTRQIHDLGKWALLVGGVCGFIAGQAKKPIPRAPAPSEPTLLDDERGL